MRERRWWLSEKKNWVMSNARILGGRFITQPKQMMCVSAMPVSVIDLNLSPPS